MAAGDASLVLESTAEDGSLPPQRVEGWLPESGATLAKFTHAAEALATQTAGLFSPKAEEETAVETNDSTDAARDVDASIAKAAWLASHALWACAKLR